MLWTILYFVMMILVFGKLALIALKMAWGITKFVCIVLLLPLLLIALVLAGLFVIAVPILAIIGLFTVVEALA